MARPIKGEALVDDLQGSAEAKLRLKMLLETVGGKRTVAAACEELGIGRSRFYELREQVLQGMVSTLEPKAPGRPASRPDPAELEARSEQLEQQMEELLLEQRIANVREEIRLVFPELVVDGPEEADGQKKKRRKTARRWKPSRKERKKRR